MSPGEDVAGGGRSKFRRFPMLRHNRAASVASALGAVHERGFFRPAGAGCRQARSHYGGRQVGSKEPLDTCVEGA